MTGPEVRDQLAQVVANVLPEQWTVYEGPPETVSLPGAVIVPRTPYRRPANMGGCQWIYGLQVTLLEARSAGVAGVDELDVLAEIVREALYAIESLAYESTDLGPMIAPGGVEAYGATLNLELYA